MSYRQSSCPAARCSSNGTVADFFTTYGPRVHPAGRVYFHLVESRKEEYPFAFLATYATGLDKGGRSKHLPLKHALQEYGNDSATMLELLSTVHLAATEGRDEDVYLARQKAGAPLPGAGGDGQKKNVIVHTFITGGTIEEKIDLMIEGKAKLSEEVIRGGGEKWITEMSNKELIGLFRDRILKTGPRLSPG
ncbi:MAG: hypothetical protein U0411_01575 [Thermodesulfovibrionales bacterium]